MCCSVLQRVQCVAVCYSVLQEDLQKVIEAVYQQRALQGQCAAACCSMLQRVAACCSVLQRVAACCSVLQCVAGGFVQSSLEGIQAA